MRNRIDERGIRSLVRDPGVRAEMEGFARKAFLVARATAPVGRSGEYQRRMFIRRVRLGLASAIYGTHSYKGWWVEFGTVNNRAHHTLANAARQVGMRVSNVAVPGGTSGIGAV